MANGYDGDIQLSVSLSPQDVRSSAQELSKAIEDVFDRSAGNELDTKFKRLQAQMSKTVTKARELENAMSDLEDAQVPTDEYKEISDQIDKARDALVKLLDKQQKFIEVGGDTSSRTYLNMQYDVEQLRETIEYAEGELQELVDTGAAFKLGSETDQYQQYASQLGDVNNTLRIQLSAYEDLEQAEQNTANTATNYTAPAIQRVQQALSNAGSKALSLVKKGLTKLIDKFKHAGDAATKFASKLNFTKVLGYAIGIRGLASVFTQLRKAITDGLTAMAKMNGGINSTNAMMTQLISTFNLLKGSLATAFAPILTIVAPILNSFMQQLANVITMIGMFIAKLTGAKSFVRATYKATDFASSGDKGGGSKGKSAQQKYEEAVKKAQERYDKAVARVTKSNEKKEAKAAEKNAENMAKAEKKQAKAAEELAKKQEKANNKLAAFDDLNVLGKEDTEDAIDALEDFKEVQAELAEMPELELPNLEDYLGGGGGAGGAGDPFGLEEIPLDGIEWNWDDLLDKAEQLGRDLANRLNKIFADEDLARDIGNFIGNMLNMALRFAYGFVDEFDWRQLGRWLGVLITEGIETFDWGLLGQVIAMFLNGLADTVLGFFETYPVGLLGSKLAEMFNRAIDTIDPNKIGQAVLDILQAPLIELKTFFTEANVEKAANKFSQFFIKVFSGKGLNEKTLGQVIGEFLASAINAAIDLLLGANIYGMIVALQTFFHDIFKSAFENIDWTDVVRAGIDKWFEILFGMIRARIVGIIDVLEFLHIISEEQANSIRDTLDSTFTSTLDTIDDTVWDFANSFSEAMADIETSLDGMDEGFDGWLEALQNIQEQYGYTDADMDRFISKMTTQNETFESAMGTLDGYTGSWGEYKKMLEQTPASVDTAVSKQKELDASVKGVGDTAANTSNKVNEYVKVSKSSMEEGTANAQAYSDNTVDALEAINEKGDEVVISFDTLTEQLNTELEGLTTNIDEWYNNMITTYFGYDVWLTLLQEGMLKALADALSAEGGWVNTWDTTIEDWWNNHVKPWFTAEKWDTDIFNPWETNRDKRWTALIKWWDDSMKDWWEKHVKTWFDVEKLWNPMFKKVEEAAEKAAEDTKTNVNNFVQEIEDFVTESCDRMIAKAQELIDKLQEAIALAEEVGNLGSSGGGSGSSSSSGSSGVSMGGSSQGGGGGAGGFMPRLDIMHFEDNLGMSAFSFPELATGAVIPPNNKFLAVLGDQKSGYNIETPLATMMEAFRSVMDEYLTPNQNHVTMELDGETFARLALPHMMDEMHRQGYNTEIIEGI